MGMGEEARIGEGGPVRCEYLTIGSGAGGSVAAMELAEAGKDVIIVEEGGGLFNGGLHASGGANDPQAISPRRRLPDFGSTADRVWGGQVRGRRNRCEWRGYVENTGTRVA